MAVTTVVSFGLSHQGKRKTFPVYVLGTATDAQIVTFINDMAPLIDAVVDAQIVDVYVTKAYVLPGGLKGAPTVPGNHVREGALLGFDAADTNYKYSVYLPSVSEGHFTGDSLDSDTEVAALTAAMVAGVGAGIDPSDENGFDLTSYLGGERTFRK